MFRVHSWQFLFTKDVHLASPGLDHCLEGYRNSSDSSAVATKMAVSEGHGDLGNALLALHLSPLLNCLDAFGFLP